MRIISRMEVQRWDRQDERNATTGERTMADTVRGLLGGECTGENGRGGSRPHLSQDVAKGPSHETSEGLGRQRVLIKLLVVRGPSRHGPSPSQFLRPEQGQKKKGTRWWGAFLMNLSYILVYIQIPMRYSLE